MGTQGSWSMAWGATQEEEGEQRLVKWEEVVEWGKGIKVG
jgi:hypothetical protein